MTDQNLETTISEAYRKTRAASHEAARKLNDDLAGVDREIVKLDVELQKQTDADAIERLLDKRAELTLSKEKLPLMLRSARANALRAEAALLQPVADAAKRRLDIAETECTTALAEVSDAETVLARARARHKEAEGQRVQRVREYDRIAREPGMALTDANRIEQGLELLVPNRFDDVE